MSNQVERFKHSKRLQKKIRAIKKQTRIAKAHGRQARRKVLQ
jgi:hypothetical protein